MEVVVEHLGAVQFEITARNHHIVSDQPEEGGGFNEGMTPPELLRGRLLKTEKFTGRGHARPRHGR